MALRLLLTALSALFAPLGAPVEGLGMELDDAPVHEPLEWVEPADRVSDGGTGRLRPSAGPEGGTSGALSNSVRRSWRLLGHAGAPAVSPPAPDLSTLLHLRRCGHQAGRLDLPPPPLN